MLIREVTVRSVSSWLSRPAFRSSELPGRRSANLPELGCLKAGLPESRVLYLVKLVPRILIQTCCASMSYTLVRVGTHRNVKRIVGRVRISPLIQCSTATQVRRT